jgi:hypothetical protein
MRVKNTQNAEKYAPKPPLRMAYVAMMSKMGPLFNVRMNAT